MAPTRWSVPFRFLDLPKELRLMVYEFISIKVAHKKHVIIAPHYKEDIALQYQRLEHDDNFMNEDDVDGFEDSIISIKKTIPALAILRVNKEILFEAEPIIRKKLDTMHNAPIQIITNRFALSSRELHGFLRLFLFRIIDSGNVENEERSMSTIHLALRTVFKSRDLHDCALEMDVLKDSYHIFQERTERCFRFDRVQNDNEQLPRDVQIVTRLALLTWQESMAADVVDPFERERHLPSSAYGPTALHTIKGSEIERKEWELDWAEGDRM